MKSCGKTTKTLATQYTVQLISMNGYNKLFYPVAFSVAETLHQTGLIFYKKSTQESSDQNIQNSKVNI